MINDVHVEVKLKKNLYSELLLQHSLFELCMEKLSEWKTTKSEWI